VRQSKGYRAMMWTTGVGIYLAGRIVILNFLKAFAFVGIAASLNFSSPIEAKTPMDVPWVLDETHSIKLGVLRSTQKILLEFAQKEKVNLRILVINEEPSENLTTLAQKKIEQFKLEHLLIKDSKTIYWVLEPKNKRSVFVVPQEMLVAKLKERLNRIEDLVITPYLQKDNPSQALAEGSVAMTTLLLIPA
jgi:hypothetical protein